MDKPVANTTLATRNSQLSDEPFETISSAVNKQSFQDALANAGKLNGGIEYESLTDYKLLSDIAVDPQADDSTPAAESPVELDEEFTTKLPEALTAMAQHFPGSVDVSQIERNGETMTFQGAPSINISATGNINATGRVSVGALVGPYGADTVSELLTKMNGQQPPANGVWNIKVLSSSGGVDALQLQQLVPGVWNLRLTMESTSRVNNKRFAEQLRFELNERGHRIDQLTFDGEGTGQSDTWQSNA